MTSKQLRRIFHALIASAPAAWVACGHSGSNVADQVDAASTGDAGATDGGTDDASDAQSQIDDLDGTVDWCEAGPPQLIREGGCYNYFYVPCGLPDETYVLGVTDGAPGPLNRCDQICIDDKPRFDCALLDEMQASKAGLVPGSNDGSDAGEAGEAGDDAEAGAGGGVVAGSGSYVVCGCPAIGRRPRGLLAARSTSDCSAASLAAHFAGMAFLEAASVPAFRRLHDELSRLSAPRRLLASIERAIADEERHARTTRRLARRFGAAAASPRVRRFSARSVEAIAIENAVEGCVRETYGALVATWQSAHASDPEIRRAMQAIAADETRHASVSFRVARFLESRLDEPARRRVRRAQDRAIRELHDEVAREVPAPDLVRFAGVPTKTAAASLLASASPALWPQALRPQRVSRSSRRARP